MTEPAAGTGTTGGPATRALTLSLYWGALFIGLALPWLVRIVVDLTSHDRSLAQFFSGLSLRLYGPDRGLLYLSLLSAAPFAVYAVFTLFHLGTAPRHGVEVTRRRRLALLLAGAVMLAVSVWGHYAIMTARGSTAAIGFIFLPLYVLVALPLGYGLGRWLARRTG